MSLSKSKSKRRMWIILNYGFLLTSVLFALIGENFGWSLLVKISFWVSVAICLLTLRSVHFKTGLWKLVHAKVDTLDEREIQLILGSLRYAYTLFSIIALSAVLCMIVFEMESAIMQFVIFWALLYLAHTLPSSIIGWTEYRIPAQHEEDKCLQS